MSQDLSYGLDIARRSLVSTTGHDGSVKVTRDGVIELLELLDAAVLRPASWPDSRERLLS